MNCDPLKRTFAIDYLRFLWVMKLERPFSVVVNWGVNISNVSKLP